jgi:CRISPR-associated protein Csd2
MAIETFVPADILARYDCLSHRRAAEILATAHPEALAEILDALRRFELTTADILKGGGNESDIPKRFRSLLGPSGWVETRLRADLHVFRARVGHPEEETIVRNIVDGHKIDFVKGRVAFDLEWNSKDQTFDRDLFAFRAFFDADLIEVGVLVTRASDMTPLFKELGVATKYGASTTWWGKLVPRLEAGRGGGCPVLAFGIKASMVTRT